MDVVAQIKAEPFGPTAGMYNIKTHLHQMKTASGSDLLWSSNTTEPRPSSPPEYRAKYDIQEPSFSLHKQVATNLKYCPIKTTSKTGNSSAAVEKTEVNESKSRPLSFYGLRKPVFKVYDNGDGLERLPSINEHSNTDLNDKKGRLKPARKAQLEEPLRLNSCPNKSDAKRSDFYRRVGDGLPRYCDILCLIFHRNSSVCLMFSYKIKISNN